MEPDATVISEELLNVLVVLKSQCIYAAPHLDAASLLKKLKSEWGESYADTLFKLESVRRTLSDFCASISDPDDLLKELDLKLKKTSEYTTLLKGLADVLTTGSHLDWNSYGVFVEVHAAIACSSNWSIYHKYAWSNASRFISLKYSLNKPPQHCRQWLLGASKCKPITCEVLLAYAWSMYPSMATPMVYEVPESLLPYYIMHWLITSHEFPTNLLKFATPKALVYIFTSKPELIPECLKYITEWWGFMEECIISYNYPALKRFLDRNKLTPELQTKLLSNAEKFWITHLAALTDLKTKLTQTPLWLNKKIGTL